MTEQKAFPCVHFQILLVLTKARGCRWQKLIFCVRLGVCWQTAVSLVLETATLRPLSDSKSASAGAAAPTIVYCPSIFRLFVSRPPLLHHFLSFPASRYFSHQDRAPGIELLAPGAGHVIHLFSSLVGIIFHPGRAFVSRPLSESLQGGRCVDCSFPPAMRVYLGLIKGDEWYKLPFSAERLFLPPTRPLHLAVRLSVLEKKGLWDAETVGPVPRRRGEDLAWVDAQKAREGELLGSGVTSPDGKVC